MQPRGIGTLLMGAIESAFLTAASFELFTGDKSEGNIRLYARLGYRVFRKEQVSSRVRLLFLEKPGGPHAKP